jgi:Alpha/beta hydrolase domain
VAYWSKGVLALVGIGGVGKTAIAERLEGQTMLRVYIALGNRLPLLALTLCFVLAQIGVALAEVTRVVVKSSGPMGVFKGRQYIWVTAMMEGTVAREGGERGQYRVPVVLMYPDHNPNGFGFVDVVNSAAFAVYKEGEAPGGKRSVYYAGDLIFSDYLRREGFTYIAVQWSRMVTDVLGADYGVIEDGRDGYEIVKDAARFLRQPSTLEGAVPFRPHAVGRVIGFGQSQTAFLLREVVRSRQNRETDGALTFDGIFAGVGGGLCAILNNDETLRPAPGPTNPTFSKSVPCGDPLPEDGKYIAIQTESDIDRLKGHLSRHQTPSSRQYELAGVAHIPPDIVDLRLIGATRQNPVSFRPVYKAMLRNLVEWIVAGTVPPDSRYIEGTVEREGQVHFATDTNGNVTGGLRLPHMPTVLPNGERAGAPLGVYRGLDPDYLEPLNVFALLGGTFAPFPAQELAARYPSQEAYVQLVRNAAAALLADRLILQEDYDAYLQAAQRWRESLGGINATRAQ